VKFVYPTRPTVQVLKGVSFTVNKGKTLALVGPSGCGKSTTVGLLERFYNLASGELTVDGIPIEEINISCLRDQIGIVGQEPVLFAMTIMENIRLGSKASVSEEKVYEACKMANIYDYIMNLPKQFETMVGERGAQLSGGQKQRVAIARALIKNPKILILDEATSALDTESEGIVQQALENAAKGRTTIVIAHRLSTVRNADEIIVIENGLIKEQGDHGELMKKKGLYHTLVKKQQIKSGTSKRKSKRKSKEEKAKKSNQQHKPKAKKLTTVEDENLLPDEEQREQNSSSSSLTNGTSSVSLSMNSTSPSVSSSLTPALSIMKKKKEEETMVKKLHQGERMFEEDDLFQHHPFPTDKGKPLWRVFKYVRPHLHYYIPGFLAAMTRGAILPVFAIFLSEILTVLLTPNNTTELYEQNKKDANFWALMFFVIAVISGLAHGIHIFGGFIAGERAMEAIRAELFRGFLRQNIAFFDDKVNSTGVLTTRLSSDANFIDAVLGARSGFLILCFTSITTGLIVGFSGSWIMALIISCCVPFLIGAQFFNIYFVMFAQINLKKAYEDSTNVAVEAVESVRTVAMLNQEEEFLKRFEGELSLAHNRSMKTSLSSGLAAGMVGMLQMQINALAMYLMSVLIENGRSTLQGAMRAQMGIMFGAMAVVSISFVQADLSKASLAIKHLFRTLDRKPLIDSEDTSGLKEKIKGEIEFKDIEFTYPTRKQTTILRGFNLRIPMGTSMALVGPSGCGKSTTVGMIERFYDPKDGTILIDGKSIKDYNVRSLRSQIGLVSQEPTLFGMSIRENVKLGAVDREVSDDEIIAACKKANAHKFIMALPEGYDTQTGEKGAQLSGGQKQRIAIARSLIADPKILILDEATSALDTESEGVVQQALDKAAEGRTTIMIAHRLSTVQKADCISVIKKGKVVEMGTHKELISNIDSEYYRLASKQLKKEIPVQK
jgi:ABC-type multidrug transport system fused ATPase/permease subunit